MRFLIAVLLAVAVSGCASTDTATSRHEQVQPQRSPEELHQEAAEAAVRELYSLFKYKVDEFIRAPVEASGYPEDVKARMMELAEKGLAEDRFLEVIAPRYVERYSTEQLELFREFVWVSGGRSGDQLTDYEEQGIRRMHDKFLAAGVTREEFVEFIDLYSIYFEKIAVQAGKAISDEEQRYLTQQSHL